MGVNLKRAFTLIELLVVIAIIAILAALLLRYCRAPRLTPALPSARTPAPNGKALICMWMNTKDVSCGISPSAPLSYNSSWCAKLLPYYPVHWTNAAYHCPGYKGQIREWVGSEHVILALVVAMLTTTWALGVTLIIARGGWAGIGIVTRTGLAKSEPGQDAERNVFHW